MAGLPPHPDEGKGLYGNHGRERANEIRQAVKDLGESNSGNQAARKRKLVELTGSESKAEKAYRDYTGGGGRIAKLFGRG